MNDYLEEARNALRWAEDLHRDGDVDVTPSDYRQHAQAAALIAIAERLDVLIGLLWPISATPEETEARSECPIEFEDDGTHRASAW